MAHQAQVTVSEVTTADPQILRRIAVVWIHAWNGEPTEERVCQQVERLTKDLASLDPERQAAFIARIGETVVGYGRVVCDARDHTVWWLVGAIVDPDYRRCGVARALAEGRLQYARRRGARMIRSETHADNSVSIAYHQAIGFVNDGPFTASDGDVKVAFHIDLDAE